MWCNYYPCWVFFSFHWECGWWCTDFFLNVRDRNEEQDTSRGASAKPLPAAKKPRRSNHQIIKSKVSNSSLICLYFFSLWPFKSSFCMFIKVSHKYTDTILNDGLSVILYSVSSSILFPTHTSAPLLYPISPVISLPVFLSSLCHLPADGFWGTKGLCGAP